VKRRSCTFLGRPNGVGHVYPPFHFRPLIQYLMLSLLFRNKFPVLPELFPVRVSKYPVPLTRESQQKPSLRQGFFGSKSVQNVRNRENSLYFP
jgi:hypothetical protein